MLKILSVMSHQDRVNQSVRLRGKGGQISAVILICPGPQSMLKKHLRQQVTLFPEKESYSARDLWGPAEMWMVSIHQAG